MDVALWTAQILLGVGFVVAGFSHAFRFEQFVSSPRMAWARDIGPSNMRVIALFEIAGGIGVLVPAVTRILPWLTPLAAAGLALLMLFAVLFHIRRTEYSATSINALFGAIAVFVALGRTFIQPF